MIDLPIREQYPAEILQTAIPKIANVELIQRMKNSKSLWVAFLIAIANIVHCRGDRLTLNPLEMRQILIVQDDLVEEVLEFLVIEERWQFGFASILDVCDLEEFSMFGVLGGNPQLLCLFEDDPFPIDFVLEVVS